jgi:hypothetical protein
LVGLVEHLRADVDAAEPATVTRVGVVPSDDVVRGPLARFPGGVDEGDHVLVGLGLGVDAGLCSLHGQGEAVEDDKGAVGLGAALEEAHHLDLTTGAGVHGHF